MYCRWSIQKYFRDYVKVRRNKNIMPSSLHISDTRRGVISTHNRVPIPGHLCPPSPITYNVSHIMFFPPSHPPPAPAQHNIPMHNIMFFDFGLRPITGRMSGPNGNLQKQCTRLNSLVITFLNNSAPPDEHLKLVFNLLFFFILFLLF